MPFPLPSPRSPLSRFALLAATGTLVAILALAFVFRAEPMLRPVVALWAGVATWLAGIRSWRGALAAVLIAAALFMALLILPVYFLLGGTFNPIANRQLAEQAGTMAALCALPVIAGWLLSSFRSRTGDTA